MRRAIVLATVAALGGTAHADGDSPSIWPVDAGVARFAAGLPFASFPVEDPPQEPMFAFVPMAAQLPWVGWYIADPPVTRAPTFEGKNTPRSLIRTTPLPRPSGAIWLKAENLGEEARVNIYKADGTFDDAALAKLDELFRCPRSGDVRAVRAELYEQMSRIYDHFGTPVILTSGYRLTGEGASSRHFHASAMDIRVQGVPWRDVYDFASTLDDGSMGLGIYPTSQFIHLDVRAPGEPSYRWTDYSGPGRRSGGSRPASKRPTPAKKPTS